MTFDGINMSQTVNFMAFEGNILALEQKGIPRHASFMPTGTTVLSSMD